MQATKTRTIEAIQALRAISDRSTYKTETTPVPRSATGEMQMTTESDTEAWARRAAHANGFGDAGT